MEYIGVEKKEKSTAEVTLKLTAAEFEEYVAKAYLKDRAKIMLPGFRKGKAPRKMIESIYGEAAFYETALDELYPVAAQFAVEESKLDVVGTPSMQDFDIDDDKNVTLKFLVSVYPEVVLSQYKGLSAPRMRALVSDKDLEAQIQNIVNQNARLEEVERETKLGDSANIDFEGFVDGVAFEGGKGEGYDLELGSNSFIPGFEDQLVGMKAGEEREINVTFPEEYQAELAGKAAMFKVKVNTVREKILPVLDDDFAKDVSEFDTFEEYKENVRKDMLESRQAEMDTSFESAILDKLADSVTCDIPDVMIDNEAGSLVEEYKYNISAYGIPFEQYLQMMGATEEQMKENLKPNADKRIRTSLALEKIYAEENIEATDDDVSKAFADMAKSYNMDEEELKKMVSIDMVKHQVRMEKARKFVIDNAVAEEIVDTPEAKAEEPASEE